MKAKNMGLALLLLRVGLGVFLLLWSVDKLIAPGKTVVIFEHFYHLPIGSALAQAIGVAELLLSISIILGFKKTLSYGLGAALHGVSTLSTYVCSGSDLPPTCLGRFWEDTHTAYGVLPWCKPT